MTKKQIAFTLIELLVVIAIIGILSGLIVVTMSGVTTKANIAKGQVFNNSLRNALMADISSEWKFDEGSGTTIVDTWGNGAGGTWLGSGGGTHTSPSWRTGTECVSSGCLYLDGTDDSVEFGTGIGNISNSNITISAWIKSTYDAPSYILTKGIWSTGQKGWVLSNASSPTDLYFVFDDGSVHAEKRLFTTRVFDWTNIVLSVSSSQYSVYKNGVLFGTFLRTFGDLTNGSKFIVGRGKGFYDDIRIYNNIISNSQVKEQYYAGLNNLLINGNISRERYMEEISSIAAK